MNNLKLVWHQRPDGSYHVCHENNDAVWQCGETLDEAIGKWVRTHAWQSNIDLKQKIKE